MTHHVPTTVSDYIAQAITKALRAIADLFFRKRYIHRAVILETVAAVPGMVAGMWLHLSNLRHMKRDPEYHKRIKILLDEAENERMHLMTFVELSQPTAFERMIVLVTQAIFWNVFFVLYVFFPSTAHRVVGYFEEEAVRSYTDFLAEIDAGRIDNVPAPMIAIDYWGLPINSTLRDVVIAVRADEEKHRDVNHRFSDHPLV